MLTCIWKASTQSLNLLEGASCHLTYQLHGSIALSLVLTLPYKYHDIVSIVTCVLVLWTVFFNGGTIGTPTLCVLIYVCPKSVIILISNIRSCSSPSLYQEPNRDTGARESGPRHELPAGTDFIHPHTQQCTLLGICLNRIMGSPVNSRAGNLGNYPNFRLPFRNCPE